MARSRMLEDACEDAHERAVAFGRGNVEAFDDADAKTFVGLYSFLHATVYGVGPIELDDRRAMLAATSAAKKLLVDEFGGRQIAMVRFMQWVWRREKMRRSRPGRDDYRIGWRLQFASRTLLTDYLVAMAKQGQAVR